MFVLSDFDIFTSNLLSWLLLVSTMFPITYKSLWLSYFKKIVDTWRTEWQTYRVQHLMTCILMC